tara:strand:+ start:1435 stop:2031 length:597 start_codon:yes stop_codon:yes gene_type:complete
MNKLNILTKTKTFTYLLPCLGLITNRFKDQIVNAFIGDDDYPKLDNHLFVLYKFFGSVEFLDFEQELEEFPIYECTYDPESQYVMKVFKIPEGSKEDFQNFKSSKYSHLSKILKTKIMAFHCISPDNPIIDILYKREAAFTRLEAELNKYPEVSITKLDRNLEASGLLDMTREIYSSRYKTISSFSDAEENFMKEGQE